MPCDHCFVGSLTGMVVVVVAGDIDLLVAVVLVDLAFLEEEEGLPILYHCLDGIEAVKPPDYCMVG